MEPLLILVTGAVPGLGKSTMARNLASTLGAQLFAEADIATDPAFADAIRAFEATGTIDLPALLDAAAVFAASCTAPVHVLDMLFPYLPSLLAWGHDDETIERFFGDLADRLAPCRAVEVHLRGDARAALRRAIAREDDRWLEWFLAKHRWRDEDAAVAALEERAARSVRLLERAPWPVGFVDARLG